MGIIPKALSGVICKVFTKIGAILEPSRAVSIEVLVFSIFASIPSIETTSPAGIKDEPGNAGISWKSYASRVRPEIVIEEIITPIINPSMMPAILPIPRVATSKTARKGPTNLRTILVMMSVRMSTTTKTVTVVIVSTLRLIPLNSLMAFAEEELRPRASQINSPTNCDTSPEILQPTSIAIP